MKRRTIISLIILGLFIIVAVYYYNTLQISEDIQLCNSIQSSVEQSLQQAEYGIVDLNELTTFEWDTLYIIKPYANVKEFCKEHNIGYKLIQYGHDENSCLLVFVSDKKIVAYVDYRREYGDFAQPDIKEKYTSKDVSFKFSQGENDWIYVEH